MKISLKIILSFLALATFVFTSCKEDEVPVETRSNLELLTNNSSKTWVIKEGKAKQGDVSLDIITSQNPCITDNQIVLFQNFDYEFREGATKCEPSDPDIILTASWQLSEDQNTMSIERFIFLGRTVDNPSFEISSVTDETFSGTSNITVSGQNFDIEVTFESIP